ncbi:hypothetical protein CBR_g41508 [Chara braunii]|uniref:Uncharacterized protein n=1 Tax=Chara braunii TaxID=69332 RepID=A0A388LW19_CHABU|nr:hypothetical protein CBR_g41508 [Chara braunii]|eukprot:GBG86514.1 hypothetical protein CBR_g41508 [Chara braunii]
MGVIDALKGIPEKVKAIPGAVRDYFQADEEKGAKIRRWLGATIIAVAFGYMAVTSEPMASCLEPVTDKVKGLFGKGKSKSQAFYKQHKGAQRTYPRY